MILLTPCLPERRKSEIFSEPVSQYCLPCELGEISRRRGIEIHMYCRNETSQGSLPFAIDHCNHTSGNIYLYYILLLGVVHVHVCVCVQLYIQVVHCSCVQVCTWCKLFLSLNSSRLGTIESIVVTNKNMNIFVLFCLQILNTFV